MSLGGKIIGAGGSGFFSWLLKKIQRYKESITAKTYNFVDFKFEQKGFHMVGN